MARLLLVAALAAVALTQGCGAPRAPSSAVLGDRTIFREISVRPLSAIQLGAPFAAQGSALRLNDSTYRLQPDGFGGTRELLIHLDGNRIVVGMSYLYGAEETYDTKVADYVKSLGPPVAVGNRGDSVWTRWEDGSTRFEVSRIRRFGTETQRSRLWNLLR